MIWRARTTFWQMIARRLDKSALAVRPDSYTSQFSEAMSQRDIEAMPQGDIIAIVDDDGRNTGRA